MSPAPDAALVTPPTSGSRHLGISLLAALIIAIEQSPAQDAGLPSMPGVESQWDVLDLRSPLRVYVPANYQPARAWPLIVFYHGTGGQPDTSMIRAFTRGRDFIVVGMEFSGDEKEVLSSAGIARELVTLSSLRSNLGEALRLDGRVLIAGFSLGGWTAERLLRRDIPGLAGVMIMGAGRMPPKVEEIQGSGPAAAPHPKIPVYIGIGQVDTNHPYSRRAAKECMSLGHPVTFDEFLGHAHDAPSRSEYLEQWLRLLSDPTLVPHEQAASDWFDAKLKISADIPDTVHRLLYLEHLQGAPLVQHVDPERRRRLLDMISQARRHPAFKAHLRAEATYREILDQELNFDRSNELISLAERLHRLWSADKTGHYGHRAALDLIRLRNNLLVLKQSLAGSNQVQLPGFPKPPLPEDALVHRFRELGDLLQSSPPGDSHAQ